MESAAHTPAADEPFEVTESKREAASILPRLSYLTALAVAHNQSVPAVRADILEFLAAPAEQSLATLEKSDDDAARAKRVRVEGKKLKSLDLRLPVVIPFRREEE